LGAAAWSARRSRVPRVLFAAVVLVTIILAAIVHPTATRPLHAQTGSRDAEPPVGVADSLRADVATATVDPEALDRLLARAEALAPLNSLLIARDGELLVERYFRGMRANRAVNVKSISKTLMWPLVGIAIRDGVLGGVDQPLHELLPDYTSGWRCGSASPTQPRRCDITLHHVLSMTTGIEGTSFGNYGDWVSSRDWVDDALRRPMVCDPGDCFEYSTGNTHLLGVILTRRTGKSLRALLKESLFDALGIPVYAWDRDPQGRYLGGNNMAMRPRDLLTFGELILDGGVLEDEELLPSDWITASWRSNILSPWNGHRYGYLWWIDRWGGEAVYFAWGYAGQYVVLVPRLDLVVVATSSLAGRRPDHTRRLREFFDEYVVPTFK
jgi:CubicO group peptidase (beta-lactamase class C family)